MTPSRIILILSVIAGTAAAALGFTAFSLARHDRQYRLTEMNAILKAECRTLAERCRDELQKYRLSAVRALENTAPDTAAVERLRRNHPLLREVFIADRGGRLLFPRDSEFSRRYEALFDELISAAGAPAAARRNHRRAASLTTRFGTLLGQGGDYGWIPWFAGNRFCPLVWTNCRKDPTRIIGAELETVAMVARLTPLFPQSFPVYYRFELIDAQGQIIGAAGAADGDDRRTRRLEPSVVLPVDDALAPNWQIRGYLVTDAIPAGGFKLALLLQIGTLLIVIAAAGGVVLGMVRRELETVRLKTSFVANVSHELKTPLTSIRMYAEMLREHGPRLPPDKQHKYLDIILSESERLTRLIGNVLDFSRLEAGRKKYHPVDLALRETVAAVAEQWQPLLKERRMRLELVMPEEDLIVRLDRDSLIQILQNLLSNAVKYAASGGLVRLELYREEAGAVALAVIDRGPGVPPGCRHKLFRKFYRCDDRTTAETSGNGLGLAIARRLIRDQHGDLTFDAPSGGGAAFTLHIPGARS